MAMADSLALLLLLLLALSLSHLGSSFGEDEADILRKFKASLSNASGLENWGDSAKPLVCQGDTSRWNGVRCRDGTIYGLRLENMGLSGAIDVDALTQLPNLRTLSFMNNNFRGSLPPVNRLTSLKALYMSYNHFSGEIPDNDFASINSLQRLYLASNNLSGSIPKSLGQLPRLVNLSLANNQFQGKIPDFQQQNLFLVDLSNNMLKGHIPSRLSDMPLASFAGNEGLCGKPMGPCKSSKKRTFAIMVAMVVPAAAFAGVASAWYMTSRRSKPASSDEYKETAALKKHPHSSDAYEKGQAGRGRQRLHFLRKDRTRFELQELLSASAEVLGSGSFGSSYKASLQDGPAMVVKRFQKANNLGKEEFRKHMIGLGKLSHPNVLPLVAFYRRKGETLLVTDFVSNRSVAAHLHGRRGAGVGVEGLDWVTRLKIIKGVARGLAYLHQELGDMTLPHGHLKSSNVLLDEAWEPLLTDYALAPVMNKEQAQQLMVGYKSPEAQTHGPNRKTDVWSLGILILELLTGIFPANYLKQGKGADLAAWVNSVVREEWTGEVFDKEMRVGRQAEGEMLKLLKIGMCCCEWQPDRRCDLREAVSRIRDLNLNDADDYSSASEGDLHSSRGSYSSLVFSKLYNR